MSVACVQFGRLERVEVGGTKGKSLTSAIKQVHTDFLAAHEKFQQVRLRETGPAHV
jgi:dynein heavy chain